MENKPYSGLKIRQNNNMYEVYLPQGIRVFCVCMPCDRQFIKDATALEIICKIIVKRWGFTKQKNNSQGNGKATTSTHFGGLKFFQVGTSEYQIFLPTGELIAQIYFPPDTQYCADSVALGYVCRAISLRYGFG